MNGRFLLDTNAVIALLNGNIALSNTLKSAKWVGISIITQFEFLSFSKISKKDEALFQAFVKRVEVVSLVPSDKKLIKEVLKIRKASKVKLPDAIISATSITQSTSLISNDSDFSKVAGLSILTF